MIPLSIALPGSPFSQTPASMQWEKVSPRLTVQTHLKEFFAHLTQMLPASILCAFCNDLLETDCLFFSWLAS